MAPPRPRRPVDSPAMSFLAAVCQMTSTSDAEANLAQAEALVRGAAARGAALVATPENTNYLGPHAEKVRRAEPLDGPTCGRFAATRRAVAAKRSSVTRIRAPESPTT